MVRKNNIDAFERASKTQGKKKLARYFEQIKDTQKFKQSIKPIKALSDKHYAIHGEFFDLNEESPYWDMIDAVCEDFGLPVIWWRGVVNNVICYPEMETHFSEPPADMCDLTSQEDIINQSKNNPPWMGDNYSYKKEFPAVLCISAYASKEDILDFVEKNFSTMIAPVLKKFRKPGVKMSKLKERPNAKRDKFIFDLWYLKRLTYSKIDQLQKEKFGGKLLGDNYIGKVIRRQKKLEGITDK